MSSFATVAGALPGGQRADRHLCVFAAVSSAMVEQGGGAPRTGWKISFSRAEEYAETLVKRGGCGLPCALAGMPEGVRCMVYGLRPVLVGGERGCVPDRMPAAVGEAPQPGTRGQAPVVGPAGLRQLADGTAACRWI
jgi:hypothetical protein